MILLSDVIMVLNYWKERHLDKIIYFDNDDQRIDRCTGQAYFNFIDYAFDRTDYFMLVYVNYYGKGYSKIMKSFRNELRNYEVKSRTDPHWPGVQGTYCPQTTYKIVFYRNDTGAMRVLKRVNKLSDWSSPGYPQDLAFFKGNQCWFYSVGHEKIAAIIHADDQDIAFVEMNKIASREAARTRQESYFDLYNEELD